MILSALAIILAIILAVFIGLPLLVIAFGVAVGIVFTPFAMAFELVTSRPCAPGVTTEVRNGARTYDYGKHDEHIGNQSYEKERD